MAKNTVPFQGGLKLDNRTDRADKVHTWDYACNLILGSYEGDKLSVTNEPGNNAIFNFPDGTYCLIGTAILPDNNIVVFLTNDKGDGTVTNPISIIGIHTTDTDRFDIIIRTNCLNFKCHNQISAKSRIISGCERKVYFTDWVRPYMGINLDSLDQYLLKDVDGTPLYGDVDGANARPNADGWDCVKFEHFLSGLPACIDNIEIIDTGGDLNAGAYQFTVRYLDENLNGSPWVPLTHPIFIYTESITDGTNIDGEPTGTNTSKSIKFTLSNLDINFTFVQFAVTSSTNGTNSISETFILDNIPIQKDGTGFGNLEYIYFGFNSTSHTVSTINDITVPSLPFLGVVAHEIHDNRLFLANAGIQSEDWGTAQRAALLSKVKWKFYKQYEKDDSGLFTDAEERNATRNAEIIFDGKTLLRDEIYALGIVFQMLDGSESPVFHIPGRPKDTDFDGNNLTTIANANNRNSHISRGLIPYTGGFDSQILDVVPEADMVNTNTQVAYGNAEHLLNRNICPPPPASAMTSVPYTMTDIGGGTRITVNFPNANDRALVKLGTNSIGSKSGIAQDYKIDLLTPTNNTIEVTYDSISRAIMSMEVWYTDGNTGRSYHELTGGTPLFVGQTFEDAGVDLRWYFNTSNFEYDPNCTAANLERWQVHNTFVTTGTNADAEIEGYMGYYEVANTPYPNVVDCNGNHIYDASTLTPAGPDLSNSNIRHHRIPDLGGDAEIPANNMVDNVMGLSRRTLDAVNSQSIIEINKIGLTVDMTDVYAAIQNANPSLRNKIVGHYIVYGNREEQDKTIVDKGLMWRAHNKTNTYRSLLAPQISPIGAYTVSAAWFDFQTNDWLDDSVIILDGRVNVNDYNMTENEWRSEYSFTPGIANYLNFGYDLSIQNPHIGDLSQTDIGLHASGLNINEYVSPSTVFDRTIKVGNYVKVDAPVMSIATAIDPDFFVVYSDDHDLGGITAGFRRTNYESLSHISYTHMAPALSVYNNTPGDPQVPALSDIARTGFHRRLTGTAILPHNQRGTGTSFSQTLTLSNERFGQETSFYETALPFPLPLSLPMNRMFDIPRGINTNTTAFNNELHAHTGSVMPNSYVSIKNNRDVFVSLQNITYNRMNTCFISDTAAFNDTLIKGGDTFVTWLRSVKTYYVKSGRNEEVNYPWGNVRTNATSLEALVESDTFNTSLAYADGKNSNYALKSFNRFTHLNIGQSGQTSHNKDNLFDGVDLPDDAAMSDVGYGYGKFEYSYNPDFGKHHLSNQAFPLSDTYDYCNNCGNREPNNVYYSNKDFAENRTDNMRIIPANQSFPIPSKYGEVTNMFLQKDRLFAHTPKALLAIQTRPQKLNSDAATIEVGIGEIGEIPPQALASVDYGYAGSEDPFGTVNTHHGTFFIEEKAGRVFLFAPGKGLSEVSKAHGEQWFKDELPVKLRKSFEIATGMEYPVRATSSENAVGFQSVYDPRLERILLHKKDYSVRPDWDMATIVFNDGNPLPGVGTGANTLYPFITTDNNITWYFSDTVGGAMQETTLNNRDHFVNEGWTLSFYPKEMKWVSFHSYQPNFMYNSNTNFYSSINNGQGITWKHDNYNYQNFYGIKYDHIIDMNIGLGYQQAIFNGMQYVSEVSKYDPITKQSLIIEDNTFNKFYAYTNSQITQERDLIVKQPNLYQEVTLPLNQTLVDRTDNYWRFSRFRDEVGDRTQTITTSQWIDILNNYDGFGQGYIDQEINPLAINVNKNLYELSRLRDRSLNVRLFYNPEEDYKIVTQILSFSTTKSLR